MEGKKVHRTHSLIRASVVVVVILCAIYVPLKLYETRSKRGTERPPKGAALSIFVTDELAGYREPYG
jgi:hypothetical protein